jgi:hypothetical protein
MPLLVGLLPGVLFGLLASPLTAEANCPAIDVRPAVRFKSVFPRQPVFYDAYSAKQIAGFSGKKLPIGWIQDGLTRGSYGHQLSVKGQYRKSGNGICAYLTEVDFTFEFKDLTIFVAKEYPRGSCRYNLVLNHEMQHVNLYKRSFDTHSSALKVTLEGAVRNMGGVWMPNQDGAMERIARTLMATLKPNLTAFQEQAHRDNAAIDTEQNYRFMSQQCPK